MPYIFVYGIFYWCAMNIQEVREFIQNEPLQSKIYIGCDSEIFKRNDKWFIDYYSVVVIHKNKHNGCKVFGRKVTEIDYTKDKRKPLYRLMQEVYKASELYLELADAIGEREVEVHLDLNPSKKYVSNQIVEQAIGYIKSTCNVVPMIKPDAWAATSVADRFLKIA
jgi:predicted RNase H-related nuclease YkuK (DUF458 family)